MRRGPLSFRRYGLILLGVPQGQCPGSHDLRTFVMISSNFSDRSFFSDVSYKLLPYQLDGSVVDYHGCNG